MKRKAFLCFFFALYAYLFCYPQNYQFRNFDSSYGLPNVSITSFAEDSEGFIWVGTKDGLCRFDGYGFKIPSFVSINSGLTSNINDVHIDINDVLWASTDNGIVSLDLHTYECCTELKGRYVSSAVSDGRGNLLAISDHAVARRNKDGVWRFFDEERFRPFRMCRGGDGSIYFTSGTEVIYRYNPSLDGFDEFHPFRNYGESPSLGAIHAVDRQSFVVSSIDRNVFYINLVNGTVKSLFRGGEYGNNYLVLDVLPKSLDEYWIATDDGLFIVDLDGNCTRLGNVSSDDLSLPSSNLRCLFKDSFDRIWIGTFFKGVSCWSKDDVKYYRRIPEDPWHSLEGVIVRALCEDDNGCVWAATEDGYLEKILPDGSITSYGQGNGFPSNGNFQSIGVTGDKIAVGSYGFGLYLFDPVLERVTDHYDVGLDRCICILNYGESSIYVATSDGLYHKDMEDDSFKRVEEVGQGFVHALCKDYDGNIWVGFFRGPVKIFNPGTGEVRKVSGDGSGGEIDNLRATSMAPVSKDEVWVTTEGNGICRIRKDADSASGFQYDFMTKDDGLPSNVSCSIVQDSGHNVWVATLGGLVSFDKKCSLINVIKFDGDNYYRYGASLYGRGGDIYFGTIDGIVSFYPESLKSRTHRIRLADVYKTVDNTVGPLCPEVGSGGDRNISIPYSESSLTIMLATIGGGLHETIQYSYQLSAKARRKKAEAVTGDNVISFVNLSPGKYTLTAGIAGDDSAESKVSLGITVVPPLYLSLSAKMLYLFLFALAITFVILRGKRKLETDNERRAELAERERQKEVYESKIDFFTNVSHEIKTPLTLIKIPVDKIVENKRYSPDTESDVMIIKSNTDKLLAMVNQLLDFQKIDAVHGKLNFVPVDLSAMVRDMCAEFKLAADNAGVSLSFEVPDEPLTVMCSKSGVSKIISNLLTNGIKYCESKVCVRLGKDSKNVLLAVESDGRPIETQEREKIFEPFYQSENTRPRLSSSKGVGIGLAYSRKLALLHNGSLSLDDSYENGNAFILTIPLNQAGPLSAEKMESTSLEDAAPADSGRHTLLIVEDDIDLNNLLKKELSDVYNIYQASDGKEAVEVLKKYPVDMVISDIVMPEMDGCQLCDYIKTNVEFSHIPVLLLTAVDDADAQLMSLQSGADYYLTKPFSMSVLKASVSNLFRRKELMSRQFSTKPFGSPSGAADGQENEFMKKLYDTVMDNIANPQFSVIDLADQMSMSRSTLFRKIKANTGQNVNEYIKIVRLKKAAELLATKKYRIKEVSYMVGFSSSSYFSREFYRQFNTQPSSIFDAENPENNTSG